MIMISGFGQCCVFTKNTCGDTITQVMRHQFNQLENNDFKYVSKFRIVPTSGMLSSLPLLLPVKHVLTILTESAQVCDKFNYLIFREAHFSLIFRSLPDQVSLSISDVTFHSEHNTTLQNG